METRARKRGIILTAVVILAIVPIVCATAYADYSVSPMGLALNRTERTGAITVTNDGNERLTIQIAVAEWTQDANGKDVYSRTRDIVFYPKVLVIDPNSEQVLRVGYQGPVPAREKAYRLFIREEPAPNKKKTRANVSFAIQFVLPVFFSPGIEVTSGSLEVLDLSHGTVKATIKNTGTVHLKISSIKVSGKSADGREIFSKEIQGWYILQGLSHTYEIPIDRSNCGALSTIDVEAVSGTVSLNGTFKAGEEMCR